MTRSLSLSFSLSLSLFSHLYFLINKVYVYISFYSTHIFAVFAFSTSQQPMPRKLVRHAVFAHIYICILSLSLSACIRRDVEFTPRFVWPSLLLPPHHPFALHPALHVSADICFIVFHVLFEINNTPASIPFFFILYSQRVRRERLVAAFNFTYSRLSIRSPTGTVLYVFNYSG